MSDSLPQRMREAAKVLREIKGSHRERIRELGQ